MRRVGQTACCRWCRRWPPRLPRTRRRSCRAKTHLQACAAVSCSAHHLLAHAHHAFGVTSTASPTSTTAPRGRRYGAGALAGSSLGLDPRRHRRRARIRCGAMDNSIDADRLPRLRRRGRLRAAMIAVDLSRLARGHHPLEHDRIRLCQTARRLVDRQRPSCRRRRTPTSPSWPAASPGG